MYVNSCTAWEGHNIVVNGATLLVKYTACWTAVSPRLEGFQALNSTLTNATNAFRSHSSS